MICSAPAAHHLQAAVIFACCQRHSFNAPGTWHCRLAPCEVEPAKSVALHHLSMPRSTRLPIFLGRYRVGHTRLVSTVLLAA